ncbi:aspartate ammonia-lyase [Caballeronia sordidicola]|uniref:Aspartate ammonia-lyase n=1 Tax=Caballeronia sordidicola TaxID=196367 RepID=A0A158GDC5_CABSO|nr:lyase family protein [Caballeronia sordidicola]SAL29927.1 aspartate ammonia-lyase [Caballeronia sordidicola]
MELRRTETDSLGTCELPADALYGIHALRGQANFPYSGETLAHYPVFVKWLARTKMVIARVNARHGKITRAQCDAIVQACMELAAGNHGAALIVDPLEGSCGTSINMNINEVLTNRALQLMGHRPGDYAFLHPLDHVNYAQSTSDVLLTAVKLALRDEARQLRSVIGQLAASLREKQASFEGILRIGRTCLQDALPMKLGQAFGGYASLAERMTALLDTHIPVLSTIALGATAVGTGLGTYDGYRHAVTAALSELAGEPLTPATDLFDAVQNMDEFAALSATVKTATLALAKVANDLVLLSSGPRGGIGELRLAPQQAGSSMMPGKVNPVHAMGLTQVAYFVAGADQSVMLAAANGQLETNNYMPLIAVSLFKAIGAATRAISMFDVYCVRTIIANADASERNLLESTAIAPALKDAIGYERTAALVAKAIESGRPLIEIVEAESVMSRKDMLNLLHWSIASRSTI